MNSISCLLILVAVLSIDAEAQFLGYPQYPAFNQFPQYFRSGQIGASPNNAAVAGDVESRFFLNGALINAVLPRFTMTSTSTTTSVITSTCTTSTAALTACSPAGRRRRGLVVNGKQARGLFYADEELDEAEKASIFLPSKQQESARAIQEPVPQAPSALNPVPFVVEPGFSAPAELRGARQFLNILTRTVTTTTTSTYTNRLTAVCSSITGFPTCSS